MQRWMMAALACLMLVSGNLVTASAQTTTLIPGGLTTLPEVKLGPDLLRNGGFETVNGSLPANWSGSSAWAVDQIVKRSGRNSYRRTTGAPNASQTLTLKPGTYKLSAWIRTENLGSASTGVRLQVDYRPAINAWEKTEVISGTRDWTYYELKNIIVTSERQATIKLENYANATGTAWFDDVRLEEQLPGSISAYLLYPNYRGMLFDDKPQSMKVDVTVAPPGDDFGRYDVRATLTDEASGAVVATRSYPATAHLVAEVDGSGMPAGRAHLLRVALVDRSNGAVVYTYPAYRVSKVPGAARQSMSIAFDEKNRVLVQGRPRFVLGVYDAGMGYGTTDAFWDNALWSPAGDRRMDGLKINFYLNYWYGEASAEAMKSLASNLQKRGVTYLQTGNCFNTRAAGDHFLINNSDAYVRDIGSHPAMGGYYVIDECESALVPGAFTQYQRLKQLDPDSMTFAALFGYPDIRFWRDAADILSSDPYPLYAAEPSGGYNHRQVADWTAETREAVKDARPIMTVLQFFKFTSQGRWPTRQEMRNHAYMAIVEGARGLWWWSLGTNALKDVCSGWCAEKTAHMNDLKSVVNEIADLEPALLADDAPGALRSATNPAIKTKVKIVNGRGYVFAYNSTSTTQNASFTWNTAPGTVAVNGEGRSLTASGSSFADSFGPYQAHVYVIGTGGSGGGGNTPTPPLTLSFTNPARGASLSGTTTVSLNAAGGTGYSYRVAVDNAPVFSGTNNAFSWNTTTAANGARTLTATVTDASNRTATATISVTVSNTTTSPPPTTPPSTPPPAGTGLTVGINSPRANTTLAGTTTVTAWVSGASGTRNYSLLVDGATVATSASSVSTVSFTWDTRRVADGVRQVTVAVRDGAGKGGQTTVSVTTRNGTTTPPPPAPANPTAAFTSPAAGATVSGTTTIGMSVSGATAPTTFRLTVSSGGSSDLSTQTVNGATASFAWNTASVPNGTHTLTVSATDAGGKTATTTRTVNVSNGGTTPPPPPPPASATGPLRVLAANPRYFTDGSGRAVYLTGSHTWTNLVDRGTSDPPPAFNFTGYLDLLRARNHNFIRLWTWEMARRTGDGGTIYQSPLPWARTGPGTAMDGKPRFDLTRFNQAYFDRLRSRVIAARSRGIYVSVMLFEGYGLQFIDNLVHPFARANNVNNINGDPNNDGRPLETHTLQIPAVTELQKAYIRKVIDTVNDLDNVLYEIVNESGPYSTQWQYAMVNYIKAYQAGKAKQHPVGMTFQYRGGSNSTLFASPADWISPNHTSAEPYQSNPPVANGRKVVISDTDHLWGVGGNRTWVWKSFTRGLNTIYMDPMDGSSSHESARRAMGQTLSYARRMNLAAMTPQGSLCSTGYCLADASGSDAEFLVYAPSGGTISLNLVSAAGTFRVEWLNPATGAVVSGGTTTGGGSRAFTPPFGGDAVLYVGTR